MIITKPDFIIIGAMKSATTSLHSQLALQPGIYMTTPKEPNYFSDNEQYERGEAWYDSLFQKAKRNDVCGESSTHYTKLPDYPLTIERMSKRLKHTRMVYVIRHPIDRLVSHYIHQWSQNVIKCDINQAIDEYEELIAYSSYARQLEPYLKQFGSEKILPVFTEAIRQDAQKQLEKVASFIGYEGSVRWHHDVATQNISSERIRVFPGYSLLVESKIMAYLRQKIVPKNIRNKIKKGLTMQERPVIDEIHLNKLTSVFDLDLGKLGGLLGVNLTCANYKQIVCEQELFWKGVKC